EPHFHALFVRLDHVDAAEHPQDHGDDADQHQAAAAAEAAGQYPPEAVLAAPQNLLEVGRALAAAPATRPAASPRTTAASPAAAATPATPGAAATRLVMLPRHDLSGDSSVSLAGGTTYAISRDSACHVASQLPAKPLYDSRLIDRSPAC